MSISTLRDGESTLAWVRRQMVENHLRPLKHHQGTMTSLRGTPYYNDVLGWDEFRNPQDGDYSGELTDIYEALGIVQGNGEWYVSAYPYDDTIPVRDGVRWNEFVCAVLQQVDPADFWEYNDDEDENDEENEENDED